MSAPTGLVLPPPDLGSLDFVESVSHKAVSTVATAASGVCIMYKFRVGRPGRLSTATVYVGTASGNIDIGICTSDGTNFVKQASTGSTVVAGSSALQAIAFTSPYTVQPGVDHWISLLVDNGTATLLRGATFAATNALSNMVVSKGAVSIPIPASQAISGFTGYDRLYWVRLS